MDSKNTTHDHCSVARVLEHVGQWYNIFILRDALQGMTRFHDFQSSLGISPNTLSKRLLGLVESKLLERRRYQERPPRDEYVITEAGREFLPIVAMMMDFGYKYFSPHGIDTVIIDRQTGKLMSPMVIDKDTGKLINDTTAAFAAGPDASDAKGSYFRARGLPLLERT